ncbi:MAG TPA: hypothetical protein VFO49_15425 [Nocardioides sp.]|nr:hypothetical protein [Nocardioides sp.]
MPSQIALVAGLVATALFVLSTLPMLLKAARTKNLSSYSGSNLVIANTGNAAQMLYVITLPPGPVWGLHAFNTAASALMLVWWVRHRARPPSPTQPVRSYTDTVQPCPSR